MMYNDGCCHDAGLSQRWTKAGNSWRLQSLLKMCHVWAKLCVDDFIRAGCTSTVERRCF